MKTVADNELFKLIQESSYPAFTELYRRHWKYIYSLAYRKTGDQDDACDLTQNVFIEFYEKREKLVINMPLKNYLRTAIIYKLSNYFRTKGFQEKHYHNFQQYTTQIIESNFFFDDDDRHQNELEFEQMVDLIYQTIDEMPEKMKAVFLMSRSEQYTINEIADKFNLSPQTVKNQISKALERIRMMARLNKIPLVRVLALIWLTQN